MSVSLVELPAQAPSHLKLFFYPKVHSTIETHRTTLRQLLTDVLNKLDSGFPAPSDLLDLNKLPEVPGKSISLSHSPRGSAILVGMEPGSVGVDVEFKERITDRVVARVAKLAEMEGAPDSADLFTAKEAAWKSLNRILEVPTISQIETYQWISLSPPWHQYYVMIDGEKAPGVGFSGHFGEICLSFYSVPSTFS